MLDPKYADFYGPARLESETPSPEYMNDWLLRCNELVNKYQPQLFWFDWWIEQPAIEPLPQIICIILLQQRSGMEQRGRAELQEYCFP